MRLTSIELENFRCFEKEKIELHPQLNVFVGMNASGKTALLEGIGLGLALFLYGLGEGEFLEYYFGENDSRQKIEGSALIKYPPTLGFKGQIGENLNLSWIRSPRIVETRGGTHTFIYSYAEKQVEEIARTMVVHHKSGDKVSFPVILYFSTQRLWGGSIEDGEVTNKGTVFSGYFNALNRSSNTSLFEKELERIQKATMQSKELGFAFDSSRLDLVRSLASKVIQDCEVFYFDYDKESLAVKFKDGRRLMLDELSDGQKSLLLISTGIAFQCATLNPHMGLDAYKSNGVVLIDEVELHLHPDWQREILPTLTREFPNIQFIATTHSPQVLSTLDRECVQVIKNFHIHPLERFVKGRDSNAILGEVFGIEKRPKEFADQLQHFYALLEDNEYDKAKEILEGLEEIWGSMDSEIVRGWLFWADGQEVVLDDAEEVA